MKQRHTKSRRFDLSLRDEPKRGRMCQAQGARLKRIPAILGAVYKTFVNCSAQATVEYLVVALALIAVISGIAALGARIQEGLFAEHAAKSASHAMTSNAAGSIGDVLLF